MNQKDPNTAMLIELLVGLLTTILGAGHFYVGLTKDGLIRLIGWWLILFSSIFVMPIIAGLAIGEVGMGISLCMILPIYVGGPIVSAIMLKKRLLAKEESTKW